jgi:hypothetical protein
MSLHQLSMIVRKFGGALAPDPAECRTHFAAGRIPVYRGRQLVAYVDDPADLPSASFAERDGRLTGMVNMWTVSGDIAA